MRRLASSLLIFLSAALAHAGPVQVVPADDPDVAAGWAAYRSNDFAQAIGHCRRAAARDERVAQFNLAVMLMAGDICALVPSAPSRSLRRRHVGDCFGALRL